MKIDHIQSDIKKFYFFLKANEYEFAAGFFTVTSAYCAYRFRTPQTTLFYSIVIVLLSLILFILIKGKEENFYYISFRSKKDEENWLGNGVFKYRKAQDAFLITNAEAGFIYPKCQAWVNYRLTFSFKIDNTCIGILLKATNLANYIMLQINKRGIRPHIRVNGGWRPWEAADVGLEFDKSLLFDKWYKAEIVTEGDAVIIKFFDDRGIFFNREWNVPGGMLIFAFKEKEEEKGVNIPFPINLEYGSFGFRNAGGEKALVRDLLVEKI